MATFVLVHGGFHGGWCWKRAVPYMRHQGHDVFTPTLTGLGERVHLATPDTGLDTHILDVVNVIRYQDLTGVVLVGHSFGGMIITGVAEAIPETLRKLIYLDAYTPKDGQCYLDLVDSEGRKRIEEAAREDNFLRWTDFSQPFGISDPRDIAWLKSKLSPHPIKGIWQTVKFKKKEALAIPRAYIRCQQSPVKSSDVTASTAGWEYYEIDAVHDVMITQPKALADILDVIARKADN